MAYKPIESYGVIGDLHTVALVGMDGSIDWCCLPHFDSPSIFAAILDERKGGFFKIASLYEAQHKQMYLPDSNVLVTRFLSPRESAKLSTSCRSRTRAAARKLTRSCASCVPCAAPYASGSNANRLSTMRDGRIRSRWKDAARCLRHPACVSR